MASRCLRADDTPAHPASAYGPFANCSLRNATHTLTFAESLKRTVVAAHWDVAEDLAAGKLVRILPECHGPADIWAATTVRLRDSAKVRVCVAFLREQLAEGPYALAG